MGSNIVERAPENEGPHIERARQSDQLRVVLETVTQELTEIEEENASAKYVEEVDTANAGIRVDLQYKIFPSESVSFPVRNPHDLELDIYIYQNDSEFRETVGYIIESNILLKEMQTNNDIMPEVVSQIYERDVMLDTMNH